MLANLKATLAARGVRQVDLALDLKISPSVLSGILNGRRSADAVLTQKMAVTKSVQLPKERIN